MSHVLSVRKLKVRRGAATVLHSLTFEVKRGAVLAIAGPSGSGKTTLLETLAGRHAYSGTIEKAPGLTVAYVAQQHQFRNLSHTTDFYYQQRYNAMDADDAATVAQTLPQLFGGNPKDQPRVQRLIDLFGLNALRDRRLLHLSNGENKKLQIAKALLNSPDVLLLDNPFTGLDTQSRAALDASFFRLSKEGLSILFSNNGNSLPRCVQEVLLLDGGGGFELTGTEEFARRIHPVSAAPLSSEIIQQLFEDAVSLNFSSAVNMQNVQVCYGRKQVLKDICWEVKRGERWSLSGPNGAGKSTLLSLITADNPQAYANQIYLFDKRRGSGESIWDIKRHIGYVSPELHLYFERTATVLETVASGFFDTIGLFRKITPAQEAKAMQWLQLLELGAGANKLLWQLPLGAQRLVLLARALVKNPPLLVLDEPLQGLDAAQATTFRTMLDAICAHSDQTLIFVSHYTEDLPVSITHHIKLEDGKRVA